MGAGSGEPSPRPRPAGGAANHEPSSTSPRGPRATPAPDPTWSGVGRRPLVSPRRRTRRSTCSGARSHSLTRGSPRSARCEVTDGARGKRALDVDAERGHGRRAPEPVQRHHASMTPGPDESLEARILLEEGGLLAVDKPHDLPTSGRALDDPDCLQWRLMRRAGGMVWAVHQLDADTTGVNLFTTERALVEPLKRAMVEKRYLAVMRGRPAWREGELRGAPRRGAPRPSGGDTRRAREPHDVPGPPGVRGARGGGLGGGGAAPHRAHPPGADPRGRSGASTGR